MGLGKTPNKELAPFYRRLGAEFDAFARRGTMLIHLPVTRLLAGFNFDAKDGDRLRRWISFFILPLYVSEEDVVLDWGWRIPCRPAPGLQSLPSKVSGTDEEVNQTIEVMREEGLANLLPALSLEGFYDLVEGRAPRSTLAIEMHAYEALAYTAILLGKPDLALDRIAEAEAIARDGWRSPVFGTVRHWEGEPLGRLSTIKDRLVKGDVDSACAQLNEWQTYTIRQLGLESLMEEESHSD